ncbi:signal peptidase II [Pseudonocardia sp. N23]|uniref:signal peptidase II n=1 Tax=Pseudonocardia sp. N23 TaxID=1987376 RepID=UPI000BFE5A52|nr:signal peptidase II [Pseudonocardia sp. N23]GAY12157.1 lipoprotein signal peptidase [Pseudonocardia sp. N23]
MAQKARSAARRRTILVTVAVGLAAIAWIVKVAVEAALSDGGTVDLGVLQLRLFYNTGVSFSFGSSLPLWVVVLVTGAITLAIAIYAWVAASDVSLLGLIGLAAVVAGAATNLVNRTVDGAVADYFHTGWFATFNLPDTYITLGVVCIGLSVLFPPRTPGSEPEPDVAEPKERSEG